MRRLFFIYIFTLTFCPLLLAQSFYPVPREVRDVYGRRTLNLSKGISLTDPMGVIDEETFSLNLKSKGVPLNIDFGPAISSQAGLMAVSGAYMLDVSPKGISVIAYDDKGALYALRTLMCLIDEAEDMKISCCMIYDWPEGSSRGLVDGYHGGSWSHELRLSMIELASSLKMDTYVYAPMTDPYVGGSDWYMPYPEAKAAELKELIEACRRNSMDFVWCIRPDRDFTWSEDDCNLLLGKFEIMHYLGVRSYGIMFDSVSGTDDFHIKKQHLTDRINSEFIDRKKGLKPVMTAFDAYYAPSAGGESAKLGIYGYSARMWNPASYNPEECLDWAVTHMMPDASQAYRTYAIHSDVCSDAFGMEESGDLKFIGVDGYDESAYEALMSEFKKIESVGSAIESSSNVALYSDLRPWLDEFVKLGTRCRRILECISYYKKGDIASFWMTYASNLMSVQDEEAFLAHPSGKDKLYPYYKRMMGVLAEFADLDEGGKLGYTHFEAEGCDIYMAPDEASLCHMIFNNPEAKEVIIRLSDAVGRYTAEFCVDSSYIQFEMKDNAVKIEVIGDVDIFEAVFVK